MNTPIGNIGLIQQTEDGRIIQLGLTQSQSSILQAFVIGMSKDTPLKKMPKQFDLVLKSDVKVLKR